MVKRTATLELTDATACCPSVLSAPLDAAEAAALALGFSALADPVRLQVLSILAAAPDGEVCVCDIVGPLGKSRRTHRGPYAGRNRVMSASMLSRTSSDTSATAPKVLHASTALRTSRTTLL